MRTLPVLFPLLWGTLLSAQSALDIDGKRDAGPLASPAGSKAVFDLDFDHDGRRDLLFAADFTYMGLRRAALRRNLGDGHFEPVATSERLGWFDAFAVADLDGDGSCEVLGDQQLQRIAPDGSIVTVTEGLGTGAAAIGDLDGDGRLDVVRGSGLRLYLQTAPLTFVLSPGLTGTSGIALSLADFDGDGDLDLLVARDGAQDGLYLNDGHAVFTDASQLLPVGARHGVACAMRDLDGDGDADLLILNRAPDASQVLLQDHGVLVDASYRLPLPTGDHTGLAFGDIDRDGQFDVVVSSRPGGTVLRGTSIGWFVAVPGAWPESRESGCVALLDVDSDGDLDLIQGGTWSNDRIHFNDGRGHFTGAASMRSVLPLGGHPVDRYAVLADFDRDGDLDVVAPGTFWRNDGFGHFDASPCAAPALPHEYSATAPRVAVGDVDGDRNLDLVVPSAFDRFRIYLGDGRGGFLPGAEYQAPVSPDGWLQWHQAVTILKLQDLDGDGDLDLLCGASPRIVGNPVAPARDSLWRNDGHGQFTEQVDWCPSGEQFGKDLAFGDLDGDGRIDMTDGYGTFLQRPDGRFDWVAPDPTGWLHSGNRGGIAVGDLDGDGDLDVAEANACWGTPYCEGEPDVVAWNDGHGVLRREVLHGDHETYDVALFDVDGDGDLDVFFARVDNGVHGSGLDELLINEGNQVLRRATLGVEQREAWGDARILLCGDLDGDGDGDLLALDSNSPPGDTAMIVWTNMTRHLRAPDLLRIGRPYALELHGVAQGSLILGAPALARLHLPPLGVLGLDPTSMLVIASFAGPTHGRQADFELRVPWVPILVGVRYAFQGVVLDAGQLRLTNRIVDVFAGG